MKRDREPYAVVPLSVITDKRLTGRDLRVYAALSTFADGEGRCWPSLAALAERCRIRAKDIPENTSHLVVCGYLEVTRQGKRLSNSYRLNGDSPDIRESPKGSDTPETGESDSPESGDSSIHTHLTAHEGVRKEERLTNSSSPVTTFLSFWKDAYRAAEGRAYVMSPGKDGAIVKRLLAELPPDELKLRAERFFGMHDPWIEENGHSIANFAARINRPAVAGEHVQSQSGRTPYLFEKENSL